MSQTPIPNFILDSLHELSGAECRFMMLVCRKTFGANQERTGKVSLGFLAKELGLSRQCAIKTATALISRSWIQRFPCEDSFEYKICSNPPASLESTGTSKQHQRRKLRRRGYRRFADKVFSRDGYECVYCGATANLTLDHVIPQSRNGLHSPENLVCACKPCNSSKRNKTLEEWLGGLQ